MSPLGEQMDGSSSGVPQGSLLNEYLLHEILNASEVMSEKERNSKRRRGGDVEETWRRRGGDLEEEETRRRRRRGGEEVKWRRRSGGRFHEA